MMVEGGKTSGLRAQKSVFCNTLVEGLHVRDWTSLVVVVVEVEVKTWEEY